MRNRKTVVVETKGEEIVRIFRSEQAASESQETVVRMGKPDAILKLRKQVFARSENECERCGKFLTWQTMHMDEKLARGKGGEYSMENCQAICYDCHMGRPDSQHGLRKPQFSGGKK